MMLPGLLPFFVLLITLLVLGAVVIIWVTQAARRRDRRLDLAQRVIEGETLSEETRREVLALLDERRAAVEAAALRQRAALLATPLWMRLLVLACWLVLAAGVALCCVASLLDCPPLLAAGVIAAVVGFGGVSYPFVLRELHARTSFEPRAR